MTRSHTHLYFFVTINYPLQFDMFMTYIYLMQCNRSIIVVFVVKLQAVVYDILPSTIAVFSYVIGLRKLSANEQIFVGAQTVVCSLQATQIISDVCFITMLLTPAQTKPKSFESRRNSLFFSFLTRGGCVSCLRSCFGARLRLQSY